MELVPLGGNLHSKETSNQLATDISPQRGFMGSVNQRDTKLVKSPGVEKMNVFVVRIINFVATFKVGLYYFTIFTDSTRNF